MLTVLTGGTGGCKLLDGLRQLEKPSTTELHAIVNTADDIEISGNLVCPDLDSVLYTFAGLIDTKRWFGLENDTYHTHETLQKYSRRESTAVNLPENSQTPGRPVVPIRRFSGAVEFMRIGDRDRATHVLRTALIDEGRTLTEATESIRNRLGIEARVLPMSNDPVSTVIHSPEQAFHFQEFWVGRQGEPEVKRMEFRGIEEARPTEAVLKALDHPVIIAPSNPVTSIGPILKLEGVRDKLKTTTVVAVSAFVDTRAFSGPAARFMAAEGLSPGSRGMMELYGDVLNGVIIHDEDSTDAPIPLLSTDTVMKTSVERKQFAGECVRFLDKLM